MGSVRAAIADSSSRFRDYLRPVTGDIGRFAVGTLIFQGSRLALSVVAAGFLGPATFGAWVLIMLVLQYASFLSLGIPNGLGREVPLRLGAGRQADAELAEDVSLLATIGTSLIGAVAVGVLVATIGGPAVHGSVVIAILVAAAAFSQQLFLLAQILLRSRFAFHAAAIQLAAVGGVTLGAGLLLLPFGLSGLITAQILAQVTSLVLAVLLLERTPHLRWDPSTARRLLSVGLPLMLAGLAFMALTTLDRWLVLTFLGTEAVGVYGLVGLAVSALLVVVTILAQQAYPHLAFAFGEGRSGAELLALAHRQSRLAVSFAGVLIAALGVASWVAIPIFLPAYEEARLPLIISMLGALVYAWASGYASVLTSVGAQREYLAIQVGAIAADFSLAVVLLRLGFGLPGVSAASASAMVLYSLGLRWRARIAARRLAARRPSIVGPLVNSIADPAAPADPIP